MKKIRPIDGQYWYLGQPVRGKRCQLCTFKNAYYINDTGYDLVVPCRCAKLYKNSVVLRVGKEVEE